MPNTSLATFILRATNLNLARSSGAPKPYKPAMLLSAILWLHKSKPADNLILLSEIKPVFAQVMAVVAPTSPMPDTIALPFRHLENDGIWRLMAADEKQAELQRLLATGSKASAIIKTAIGVQLDPNVFTLLRDSAQEATAAAATICQGYREVFRAYGADPDHVWRQLAVWLGTDARADEQALSTLPQPSYRALTERLVEDHIVARWAKTPFGHLAFAGRQVLTPMNTIDLLAHNPAAESWTVIELKRSDGDDRVVGQLARYRGWIAHDRASGDHSRVAGAIVTDVVTDKLAYSVRTQVGVELWRYDANLAFERLV
jgi:hypothetical protein